MAVDHYVHTIHDIKLAIEKKTKKTKLHNQLAGRAQL